MKNFTFFVFSLLIVTFSFHSYGQNGPGGVGSSSNLSVWMNASRLALSNGDPVNSWLDLSGNGNDANEVFGFTTPTFLTNQINGKPAIDFSAQAILEFSSNVTNLETTVFSVHQTPSSSPLSSPFALSNHVILENTNQITPIYFNPTQNNILVGKARDLFSVYSLSSEAGLSGVNVLATNGTNSRSLNRNQGAGLSSSNLGARNQNGYKNFSSGQIAEFIVYNERLNSAKRKIVGNHLAAKYNLTAEQNLYSYKSAYGQEVIGIGREIDGAHIESRGQDSLMMNNPSSLGNGDYLLIGNDGAGFSTSSNVPASIAQRWTQIWRTDVTGSPGTIDLTFYLGSNDFSTDPNNYVVLIENVDGNFVNGGTTIQETGRVYDAINKTITFTGITLADGDYFTLGEKLSTSTFSLPFGPGGVGSNSNLETWLDASSLPLTNGDPLTNWTDLSGNGNNSLAIPSITNPTFQSNQINGLPAIDFSGNAALEFLMNITTLETTIFSIHNTPSTTPLSAPFAFSNHVFLENSSQITPVYLNPTQNNILVGKARDLFSVYSLSSESGLSGVNVLATNGTNTRSSTRNQGAGLSSSNIGVRNQNGYRNFFSGKTAEIIVFNENLSSAKRKIVSNYLGAKYNLTAEQNLYAHKSTHGRDVIGIGQESDGSHLESRGLDSLKISNASALGNGDYLLVGNDGAGFTTSTSVGADATGRWTKVWRAGVTGTPGTVDLVFYLGSNDFAVDKSKYGLLIENVDGNFSNGGTNALQSGMVYDAAAKTVTFSGVSLADGDYFTLAEVNPIPTAIADGDWHTPSTWSCDCVPTATSDVTITSPHDVTINQLADAKSVTITSGGSLTLGGSNTLRVVESLTVSGVLNSGTSGTILANGTSNQTFANNSGSNIEFVNLVSDNSASLLLTGGWTLSNSLQVNAGTLNVSGADSLVLLSNATKTAEILPSNGSFVGDFTLQRFISARNANFANISSPITNATVASLDDDVKISGVGGSFGNASASGGGIFYSMYVYDRTNNNTRDTIQSTATALTPGVGYELYLFTTLGSFSATTLDFVGTPNFGFITPPSILNGVNLVGNPYHAHLITDNLDNSNIQLAYYVFNTNSGTYDILGPGDRIAPGQGFWINNTSGGTVPFNFDEGDKSYSGSSAFLRQKNSKEFALELSNEVNYFKNKVTMGFDYSATEGIDQFDANYLPSPMENASELYFTTNTEEKLARNTLNQLEESHVVPMEVKIGEAGTYTIQSSNVSSILENYSCVYLKDQATNESVDLSVDQGYTFEATSGVTNRFNLVVSNSFEACEKALATENTSQKIDSRLKLRESYGDWFLDYNLGAESQTLVISVYGINGQQVLTKMEVNLSENGTYKLNELNTLNGIFVIQIVGGNEVVNQTIKL